MFLYLVTRSSLFDQSSDNASGDKLRSRVVASVGVRQGSCLNLPACDDMDASQWSDDVDGRTVWECASGSSFIKSCSNHWAC